MEHLGDAVAGRYVLVAPSSPHAARRQYHAVDMLLDRTVTVRFEPRETAARPGMARLKTADGCRVLDIGTFEGEHYVVVDAGEEPAIMLDVASVADLEDMLALPSVDPPAHRATEGFAVPAVVSRGDRWRNRVLALVEIIGGVTIVVLLVAAGFLALGGSHRSDSGGPVPVRVAPVPAAATAPTSVAPAAPPPARELR